MGNTTQTKPTEFGSSFDKLAPVLTQFFNKDRPVPRLVMHRVFDGPEEHTAPTVAKWVARPRVVPPAIKPNDRRFDATEPPSWTNLVASLDGSGDQSVKVGSPEEPARLDSPLPHASLGLRLIRILGGFGSVEFDDEPPGKVGNVFYALPTLDEMDSALNPQKLVGRGWEPPGREFVSDPELKQEDNKVSTNAGHEPVKDQDPLAFRSPVLGHTRRGVLRVTGSPVAELTSQLDGAQLDVFFAECIRLRSLDWRKGRILYRLDGSMVKCAVRK